MAARSRKFAHPRHRRVRSIEIRWMLCLSGSMRMPFRESENFEQHRATEQRERRDGEPGFCFQPAQIRHRENHRDHRRAECAQQLPVARAERAAAAAASTFATIMAPNVARPITAGVGIVRAIVISAQTAAAVGQRNDDANDDEQRAAFRPNHAPKCTELHHPPPSQPLSRSQFLSPEPSSQR